ncbi:Transmembrane secretion effector [Micromonospora matsumotoense]|uniref:Transmembrane secretion effector n=2 Tax=Micromonospora matsumotoense TaxID=121616 RepID=A0A1C4YUJ0_9ACTN|nr:Transmembrane secretion effector [Micromonospora matsumotoense]
MMQPLVILLLVRQLGLPDWMVGILLALAGVGGILGALVAGPVAGALGRARVIWLAELVCVPSFLLLPAAGAGLQMVLFAAGYMLLHVALSVFNVANLSFRQAICPDRLLGRMNASVRFLMWGALPLGALVGGLAGEHLSARGGLVVAGLGVFLAVAVLLASPLRSMRDLPMEAQS